MKHREFPPLGELTDIGGYRLHWHSQGSGTPTVVLDAGLGGSSVLYTGIQPMIAEFTTAWAYDRAGYGWSDPAPRHIPRTSRQLVQELRLLLNKTGFKPPYIMVANSFGAINVLLYAALHPEEVAGMVLIDPIHHEMYDHMPYLPSTRTIARLGRVLRRLARWGVLYWLAPLIWDSLIPHVDNLPPHASQAHRTFITRSKGYYAWWREAMAGEESLGQLRHVGCNLRDIPFLVLFGGKLWSDEERHPFVTHKMKADARALGYALAQSSTRGELRIVKGAYHTMQVDHPHIVVDAVREVVEAARGVGMEPSATPSISLIDDIAAS
jgi:pimeloyl-ACP methyl ester carboxylesterase